MSQSPDLRRERLDALVHYITTLVEPHELGKVKLQKILWFVDRTWFARHGEALSGWSYVKGPRGPMNPQVDKSLKRLEKAGAIRERRPIDGPGLHEIVWLKEPNTKGFTSDEISLVDRVTKLVCQNHTAGSISNLTHDHVWEAASMGEEIPLHTVFVREAGEPSIKALSKALAELTEDGEELTPPKRARRA